MAAIILKVLFSPFRQQVCWVEKTYRALLNKSSRYQLFNTPALVNALLIPEKSETRSSHFSLRKKNGTKREGRYEKPMMLSFNQYLARTAICVKTGSEEMG